MAAQTFNTVEDLMAAARQKADALRRAAMGGLRQEADDVLADAQRRVPVETGELRESGEVRDDPATGSVAVVFTAPHSVYVHEDLSAAHPMGQAKFLESAALEAARGLPERVAQHVRKA